MDTAERLLREARDEFKHLAEYWNGLSNARALLDACEHTVNEAEEWMKRIDAHLSSIESKESAAPDPYRPVEKAPDGTYRRVSPVPTVHRRYKRKKARKEAELARMKSTAR